MKHVKISFQISFFLIIIIACVGNFVSCVHFQTAACYVSTELETFDFDAKSGKISYINGALFYGNPGFYDYHICCVRDLKDKTVCTRVTVNCESLDTLIQSQGNYLIISGYKNNETRFFKYNTEDATINEIGSIDGYIDSWMVAEDRIYYTKYSGSMLWNRDLYCYSLTNNSSELVDCDVVDFLVLSNELLIAVAKPETNEIAVKKNLLSEEFIICEVPFAPLSSEEDIEPHVVLSNQFLFVQDMNVVAYGTNDSKVVSLVNGSSYVCPSDIEQVLMEGDYLYYTKMTDTDGSYGKKLYKWSPETEEELILDAKAPILLMDIKNGRVLVEQINELPWGSRGIYIIDTGKKTLAASF